MNPGADAARLAVLVAIRFAGWYLVSEFIRSLRTPRKTGVTMAALGDIREDAITWRVHPARERVGAACGAVAVIAGFAWAAGAMMENLWWGVFAGLFLFAMLNRFFLTSEFTVDGDGVTARYPWRSIQFTWDDVRRFVHDRRGGFLSTRRRSSMLDAFGGMHLLFAKNRDAVVSRIETRLHQREAETR